MMAEWKILPKEAEGWKIIPAESESEWKIIPAEKGFLSSAKEFGSEILGDILDVPRRTASTAGAISRALTPGGGFQLGELTQNPDVRASAIDLASILGGLGIGKIGATAALKTGLPGKAMRAAASSLTSSPFFAPRETAGDIGERAKYAGVDVAVGVPAQLGLTKLLSRLEAAQAARAARLAEIRKVEDKAFSRRIAFDRKTIGTLVRDRLRQKPIEKITRENVPEVADRITTSINELLSETGKITAAELDAVSKGTYTKAGVAQFGDILTSPETGVTSRQFIREAQRKAELMSEELKGVVNTILERGETEAMPAIKVFAERLNGLDVHFRQLRSEAGRSLQALNRAHEQMAELGDVAQAIGRTGAIKDKKAIFEGFANIAKKDGLRAALNQTHERLKDFTVKDAVSYWTKNIFPVFSGLRDLATNAAAFGSEVLQDVNTDVFDFVAGKAFSFPRSQGILRAIRNPFKAPDNIKEMLHPTALGEKFGVIFSPKLDHAIFAPAELKRGVDTTFKRVGAMSHLYAEGIGKANLQGLKGSEKTAFIRTYVMNAPEEAIAAAAEKGRRMGFDRELSKTEEAISRSAAVKLLATPFPRWSFQFTRFVAEHTPLDPTFWGKVSRGAAKSDDFIKFATRSVTGTGGLLLANDLLYDRVDFSTSEYVREDGSRIKLTGLTPIPDALALAAIFRDRASDAFNMLQASSFPFVGGPGEGILTRLWNLGRDQYSGIINAKSFMNEFDDFLNDLIPGKGMLAALAQIFDPKVREGFTKDLPVLSRYARPKIDPTTGEEKIYKAKIPIIGEMSKIPRGFPGAARVTSKVESELYKHGFGVKRPRRLPYVQVEDLGLDEEFQIRYEKKVGSLIGDVLGSIVNHPTYDEIDEDVQKDLIQSTIARMKAAAREIVIAESGQDPSKLKTALKEYIKKKKAQTR